jgi:hypothetical protein
LASIGHRALRVHVATVDAFPSGLAKYETTWSCLVDAVGDVEALQDELEELRGDHELKEQVINYVRVYTSQPPPPLTSTSFRSGGLVHRSEGNLYSRCVRIGQGGCHPRGW